MRRFFLTVATAATALVGTACGDSTGLGSNPAGSYELISVDGQAVPYDDGFVIFCGGLLDLDSDGTFVDILQLRGPGQPICEGDPYTGDWEREGDDIILNYHDNSVGTLVAERRSSNRLVIESDGYTLEYRRF